jgi:hypothetical protein
MKSTGYHVFHTASLDFLPFAIKTDQIHSEQPSTCDFIPQLALATEAQLFGKLRSGILSLMSFFY